ncbi:unnamed protein product [Heterobilharzia americana]|nr:unnamed protein product [Heterobilharzia americana]
MVRPLDSSIIQVLIMFATAVHVTSFPTAVIISLHFIILLPLLLLIFILIHILTYLDPSYSITELIHTFYPF